MSVLDNVNFNNHGFRVHTAYASVCMHILLMFRFLFSNLVYHTFGFLKDLNYTGSFIIIFMNFNLWLHYIPQSFQKQRFTNLKFIFVDQQNSYEIHENGCPWKALIQYMYIKSSTNLYCSCQYVHLHLYIVHVHVHVQYIAL